MMRSRSRPVLARALVVAGFLGASLLGAAPASAQWGWGLPTGPIPPGAIVRSLMNRGFLEIGRPRFTGEAYVVEAVNARGQRLRLVIDAYDGDLISRTRLDAPLLPPADVGRGRAARVEPFGPEPGFEDEIAPPSPGRDFGRERIERGDVPPPPATRRAERIDPPLAEPRRGERTQPQRQAGKPAPSRQPAKTSPAEPQTVPPAPVPAVEAEKPAAEPPAATAAVPAPPVTAREQPATPTAPAAPAPATETPAAVETAPPAQSAAQAAASPQRPVRIIEGVTPVVPQAESRTSDEGKKSEITPPAILE